MAKSPKDNKDNKGSKPAVHVDDLKPSKDPKGGSVPDKWAANKLPGRIK